MPCKVNVNEGRSSSLSRAPKGHFVVYVGEELRRFVVPLSYLKNLTLQQLLEKAAEEYGFGRHQKRIVLPCDESTFRRAMEVMAVAT